MLLAHILLWSFSCVCAVIVTCHQPADSINKYGNLDELAFSLKLTGFWGFTHKHNPHWYRDNLRQKALGI
jgi:hypothetical protein